MAADTLQNGKFNPEMKRGHHFVDRNKMKKIAEKGVFLYTPFRETCYNSNAETESCQVSFSLSCRAAFFSPCRGNPALTQQENGHKRVRRFDSGSCEEILSPLN